MAARQNNGSEVRDDASDLRGRGSKGQTCTVTVSKGRVFSKIYKLVFRHWDMTEVCSLEHPIICQHFPIMPEVQRV